MLHEDGYMNTSTNDKTVVWWNEFCGNSSPYNAFWVSW